MTPLTLRLGDRTVQARVDANGTVQIDSASFSVTAEGPGLYVVDDGTRRWRVAVADAGEVRWVSVDGQVAVVEVETGAAPVRRKKTAAGDAIAGALLICFLATIHPARGASRLDPAEALRYE